MAWHIHGHRIHFGWIVICVVILTAAAGGFGGGPSTRLSASSADRLLHLKYDGLWRMNAPTTLALRTSKPLDTGSLHIALNRAYLENVRIDWILPQPYLVHGSADHVSFHFIGDPENPGMAVDFSITPLTTGMLHAQIAIEGSQPIRFRQFIYP
ncbi:MAG: hypothetical protein RBT81_02200 [Gammaproteobacteria bacterium]|jgi:hypothetical protein|nr:hypothetical protein [Gammaproteobacteria bacterium]